MLQKIMELISVLDQRKDESIERTFKGVARHFREVFSELVQGGHGYLVMMKKKVPSPLLLLLLTDLISLVILFLHLIMFSFLLSPIGHCSDVLFLLQLFL